MSIEVEDFPDRIGDVCALLHHTLADNEISWGDAMAAAAMLAAYLCCIQPVGTDRAATRKWFITMLDVALAKSPPQSTHDLAKTRFQ